MRQIHWQTKREFVEFYVDFFQLLYFPHEEHRAKDRLREFLIHLVLMHHEEWVLYSSAAVHEIADRMGFKNRDEVYNYRKKLKKMGLLIQTKEDLMLPGMLRLLKIPKKFKMSFEIVNLFVKK